MRKYVVFEEEETWEWGRTEEEIKRDILEWEDESDGEDDQNKKENGETDSNSLSSNPTKLPPKGSNCLSSNPTESPPNEPNTYGELNEGRGKRERRSP